MMEIMQEHTANRRRYHVQMCAGEMRDGRTRIITIHDVLGIVEIEISGEGD